MEADRCFLQELPTEILFSIVFNFLPLENWPALSVVCSWADFIVKMCWKSVRNPDLLVFSSLRQGSFSRLMGLCKNLEHIRVDCTYLKLRDLDCVVTNVKGLWLESADNLIDKKEFFEVMKRFSQLETLKISTLGEESVKTDLKIMNNFFKSTQITDLMIHRVRFSGDNTRVAYPEGLKRLKIINSDAESLPVGLKTLYIKKTENIGFMLGLDNRTIEIILRDCPVLVSLTIIDFTNNLSFTNNNIQLIASKYKNLEKFKISRIGTTAITSISDLSLMILANSSQNLSSLRLDRCSRVTDASILEFASNCSRLQSISLAYSRITDDSLSALSALNLKKLNLKSCKSISQVGLIRILTRMSELTHLILSSTHGVTDEVIETIEFFCVRLETLILNDAQVTNQALISLTSLRGLKHLSLNFLPFTEFSNFFSAGFLPNLISLSIADSKALTDSDVQLLSSLCKSLNKLNLQLCFNLTDISFEAICRNLKKIKYLDMSSVKLTTNIINLLPMAYKSIKFLKISALLQPKYEVDKFRVPEKFRVLVETNNKNISVFKFKC